MKKFIAIWIFALLVASAISGLISVNAESGYSADITLEDSNGIEKSSFWKGERVYININVKYDGEPASYEYFGLRIKFGTNIIYSYSFEFYTNYDGNSYTSYYLSQLSDVGTYSVEITKDGNVIKTKNFYVLGITTYRTNYQTDKEEVSSYFSPGQSMKISVYGKDSNKNVKIKMICYDGKNEEKIFEIIGKTDSKGYYNYTYKFKTISEDKAMDSILKQYNITGTIENSNKTIYVYIKTNSFLEIYRKDLSYANIFAPGEIIEINARIYGDDYYPIENADLSFVFSEYTEGIYTVKAFFTKENKVQTMSYKMDKNGGSSTIYFESGATRYGGDRGYFIVNSTYNQSQEIKIYINDIYVGSGIATVIATNSYPAYISYNKDFFFKKIYELKNQTTQNGKFIYEYNLKGDDVDSKEYKIELVRFGNTMNKKYFTISTSSSITLDYSDKNIQNNIYSPNDFVKFRANVFGRSGSVHTFRIDSQFGTETMTYIVDENIGYTYVDFQDGGLESGGSYGSLRYYNSFPFGSTFEFYIDGIYQTSRSISAYSYDYFYFSIPTTSTGNLKPVPNADVKILITNNTALEGTHTFKIISDGITETMTYTLDLKSTNNYIYFKKGGSGKGSSSGNLRVDNSANIPKTYKFYIDGVKVGEQYINAKEYYEFYFYEQYFYKIFTTIQGKTNSEGEFSSSYQIPSEIKDGTFYINLIRFDEIVDSAMFNVKEYELELIANIDKTYYYRGDILNLSIMIKDNLKNSILSGEVEYKIYKNDVFKDKIKNGTINTGNDWTYIKAEIPSKAFIGQYIIELKAKYKNYDITKTLYFYVIYETIKISTDKTTYDIGEIVSVYVYGKESSLVNIDVFRLVNNDYVKNSDLSKANMQLNSQGVANYYFALTNAGRYSIKATHGNANDSTVIEVIEEKTIFFTMKTEKSIYSPGENVVIYYELTNKKGEKVNAMIEWNVKSESKTIAQGVIGEIISSSTNSENSFSFNIPNNYEGNLTINANAIKDGKKYFGELEGSSSNQITVKYLNLILTTSKDKYDPEDKININYKVVKRIDGSSVNARVFISISSPSGVIETKEFNNSEGSFEFTIPKIPSNSYTIKASAIDNENHVIIETKTINKDSPLKLTIYLDKDIYKPGETIILNYEITMKNIPNYKFSKITISYYLSWDKSLKTYTIITKESNGKIAIKIPDDVPEGNYVISVYVLDENGNYQSASQIAKVSKGFLGILNFTPFDLIVLVIGIIGLIIGVIAFRNIRKMQPKKKKEFSFFKRKTKIIQVPIQQYDFIEEQEIGQTQQQVKQQTSQPRTQQPQPIVISCPKCQKNFQITSSLRPLQIKCPNCGTSGVLN